jgi:hypothetical protein
MDTGNARWKLCCSEVYKDELIFFSQIIFLLMVVIFSMHQILNKVENQEIYFSLLGSALGTILPAPSMTRSPRSSTVSGAEVSVAVQT